MHSYGADFAVGLFERCDELGNVPVGDPAQLADLDAAELAGAEKVVHLVPSDVQHFRDLLDRVCLQMVTSSGGGWRGSWSAPLARW
jgi:hypothetical protein